MKINRQTARQYSVENGSNFEILRSRFENIPIEGGNDAELINNKVIGVCGMKFDAPIVIQLVNDYDINLYLQGFKYCDNLFVAGKKINHFTNACENMLPEEISDKINHYIEAVQNRPGTLNNKGEHIFDITSSPISPHFAVNLLLGNRIGYEYPLQTTPKAVVDWLGRGSFRSHSAMQVTAARWDMRPEENGFPANRQFYIIENGKQIFYSANVNDNIESGYCVHSQNHTVITYKTKCGLIIKRIIFLLMQQDGLPQAIESQRIIIENTKKETRKLKIIYTGMFGTPADQALVNDVVYSTVIMESEAVKNGKNLAAFSSNYYPSYFKEDKRFVTLYGDGGYFTEFCADYTSFVGAGTINYPQNVSVLPCRHSRKGPGFFALGKKFTAAPSEKVILDTYTGAVTAKKNIDKAFDKQIKNLFAQIEQPEFWDKAFDENIKSYQKFASYLQIKTNNTDFDAYVNNNLPFQILYQTFVSRSFAQTQKGFREIGFREIQDIYPSMYYMAAMNNTSLIKQLITEWANNVYEFGYTNHNFYWKGKEAGICSDDGLWLAPAVYRYISLTGDTEFLSQECKIAGSKKTRTIYQTLQSIIRYSGEISVGIHGFPLLDRSDWNDCLKLDDNWIDGPQKERKYRAQLKAKGQNFGEPFENNLCESVMNLFLLIIAVDYTRELSQKIADKDYSEHLEKLNQRLRSGAHKFAWKGDFFARVMINRYADGKYTYLGAKGDGLSSDENINGTYFLNSFSWSILSKTATEEQISAMLVPLKKHLLTEAGLKLNTPADLERLATGTASGHYFPGDRENGGVFKHATMMAASALLRAAKTVKNRSLAKELTEICEFMLNRVLPFKTLLNPFVLKGNPRFCTQYNNSETNENIGPMVSGTASWLTLTLFEIFGINLTFRGIELNPLLLPSISNAQITLKIRDSIYNINIKKSEDDSQHNPKIKMDGAVIKDAITVDDSKGKHNIDITV